MSDEMESVGSSVYCSNFIYWLHHTRYLIMDPSQCFGKDWNSAVEEGCSIYSQRMHNLFLDNCHSHVARCLNEMSYGTFVSCFLYYCCLLSSNYYLYRFNIKATKETMACSQLAFGCSLKVLL